MFHHHHLWFPWMKNRWICWSMWEGVKILHVMCRFRNSSSKVDVISCLSALSHSYASWPETWQREPTWGGGGRWRIGGGGGCKKKKAKKTKVYVLHPQSQVSFLTVSSLPRLLISNQQTFHTTITSKHSVQNGYTIRNQAAPASIVSSIQKMAPTFPLAIASLIHGVSNGKAQYIHCKQLNNGFHQLKGEEFASLTAPPNHPLFRNLPANQLGQLSPLLKCHLQKTPIHPLCQLSISISHLNVSNCFGLSLQHLNQPIYLHQHPQSFHMYLFQSMLALPPCLSLVIVPQGPIWHLPSSALCTAWWKGFATSWRKIATLYHIPFSMLNGRICRKWDWRQLKSHSSSMQSQCGPSFERFDCEYYLLHRCLWIRCLYYGCYEARTLYIFIINVTNRTLYNYILPLMKRIHNYQKNRHFRT